MPVLLKYDTTFFGKRQAGVNKTVVCCFYLFYVREIFLSAIYCGNKFANFVYKTLYLLCGFVEVGEGKGFFYGYKVS